MDPLQEQLTEDDIPGASLGDRQPNQLTIPELKLWLKCRGVKSSKLKTKAEYVAKVEMLKNCMLPIIDPTENSEYISQKKKLQNREEAHVSDVLEDDICLPKEGWARLLNILPEFTDINIHAYSLQSGKKVIRLNSEVSNEVSKKTCVKPEKRGYQFYDEKYLHDIWVSQKNEFVFVKAKCFASQRKNESPHQLWCALTKSFPSEVSKSHCSCVAGASGFCNHMFALLYQIAHFSKSGMKEVPLEVSKTSLPQQWDKPRIWGVHAEPVMDTVHARAGNEPRKKKAIECSLYESRGEKSLENEPEKLVSIQKKIGDVNPLRGISYMAVPDNDSTVYVKTRLGTYTPLGSVLSYQLAITEGDFNVNCNWQSITSTICKLGCSDTEPFPDLPLGSNFPKCTLGPEVDENTRTYLESVMIDKKMAANLEKETRDQAQCELWIKERKNRLTASNFGRIISRKGEKGKLVHDLLSDKKINAPSLTHGRKYEDVAALKYCRYMCDSGHSVELTASGLVVSPSYAYLGCTPDRKVVDKSCHPHYGLAEIKCPYTHRNITPYEAALTDKKFFLEIVEGKLKLKKGHNYYDQIQGQMGISGLKWCDFIVYTFKGMHVERIGFDEDNWLKTLSKLECFYFKEFLPILLTRLSK